MDPTRGTSPGRSSANSASTPASRIATRSSQPSASISTSCDAIRFYLTPESHGPPGGVGGGPGPLEVEPAEPAGDVHDLADEIEPGDVSGFHRLRRQLGRVH